MLTLFMDALHPWVAYGVLPLFAFSAAGFRLGGMGAEAVLSPVAVGIALPLLLGPTDRRVRRHRPGGHYPAGRRPAGSTWLELLGVAILTPVLASP